MNKQLKNLLGPLRRPLGRMRQRYQNGRRLTQWRKLLAETEDLSRFSGEATGPRIVVMGMIGHMYLTNFEVPLALALAARGANVEMVFDDATFPLCELTVAEVVRQGREAFCGRCVSNMRAMTDPTPLTVRTTSEFVDERTRQEFVDAAEAVDLDDVLHYAPDGIPIGRAAFMVALRHFRKGALDGLPQVQDVLRKYLVSAMITRHTAQCLADERTIHAALMSHGIYTSWEPAMAVFLQHGVRVASYDRQPGHGRFQFNWDCTPQNGDISPAWNDRWKPRPLTDEQDAQARGYLASRETFAQEACKYSDALPQDPGELRRELNIPPEKTALLLVSNLVWDAAAVGRDLIFSDTLGWVSKTIDTIISGPDDLHLIIKPHPAEVLRGTKLFVGEEIHKRYPSLPGNITVLPADTRLNPMSLMKAVDAGIAHTSTAGLEMTALGKPVITVSAAHYRDKGFTFDPKTLEQYQELLRDAASLPGKYSDEMKALAIKYLFVRFFRYQHYLPITREKAYLQCVGYDIASLDDLLPGCMEHLDFVCDVILKHGRDFVRD